MWEYMVIGESYVVLLNGDILYASTTQDKISDYCMQEVLA